MKEINYKSETIKLSQSLNKKELAMWQSLSDMYRVCLLYTSDAADE